MNRHNVRYVLLGLGIIAVFALLLVHAQSINEDLHNQYRSDLRQLDSLHAVLNENILRAKLGLLTYYDPLNQTLDSIDQIRDRLGHVPAFISDQGQHKIYDSLGAYDQSLAQQRNLVEHFKTQNAVLRNSMSYFTIVVSDLTTRSTAIDIDPAVKGTLNALFQDVLLYNTTADSALVRRIQDHLDLLQQNKAQLASASDSFGVDLPALTSHTNVVLQRKPIIDSIIDQIFALPIPKELSELSALYDSYYETARQTANLYQIALYVFSLLVVGYIAATIIARMRKSAAIVSKAREELQVTYGNLEKRSHELEVANVELEKATQVAYEASRLKDEFLATMSHELRTPLNAIIGFQGILLLGGKLDERTAHMVRRAQSNAQRLLALINDILDISRIESGRLQLAPAEMQIAEVVEKWQAQMSVLAEQKGLKFSVHVDETMPPSIHADEDAVTKIVTNLLGNAFKFTEKGKVALDVKRSNGNWVIDVSDTGIGVPAHMQQVIFERFRQVDGSTKRKYGGSGLGLAIVHKLCQAMNGTITIQSLPDEGTTFTVTLPLNTMEREPYGVQ